MAKVKYFTPVNESQKLLCKAIENRSICFAVGPAGCGKTVGGVGIALSHLQQKAVKKIIIARPAIEAGESLGFLPGTIEEKLKPYLVPIFDAIEKLAPGNIGDTISRGPNVEIMSFSHMRGRSFDCAFIVVDEAQNATLGQLEMLLTRLGRESKMIITGDPAQSDLKKEPSGLPIILELLRDEEEIPIIEFNEGDNQRHPVVSLLTRKFATYHAIHDAFTKQGKGNLKT